jgi:predicted alpha/beta superfamily hydrolase
MPELVQEQPLAQPDRDPNSSITGDLRIHDFASRILRNTRKLRVWLPPGYDAPDNTNRYPVLYLQDGQNLFDRVTAFGGVEWQVDETADILIREGKVPPMIIVGIDNTGRDRLREYIPYRSFNPPVLRPQGKRYADFMLREVLPFIESEYRLAKGPEHTGIGGSSLGGLISLYTAMAGSGVFGRLLIESPSLFVAGRAILREARSLVDWAHRIYLGVGTRETGNDAKDAFVVEDVQELEAILRRRGLGADRLLVNVQEGATHSEGAWASRFPEALSFLFGEHRRQS